MNVPRTFLRVGVVAAVLAAAIVGLVMLRPLYAGPHPGVFTISEATLIPAYFSFPALLFVAGGLLIIAVLLLVGAATERRSDGGDRQRR